MMLDAPNCWVVYEGQGYPSYRHPSRHKTDGMDWFTLKVDGLAVYLLIDQCSNERAQAFVRECGGLGGFVLETVAVNLEPEFRFFWKRSHAEAAGFRWQMQRRVERHRMLAERAMEVAT
jgi:hypothetical protein